MGTTDGEGSAAKGRGWSSRNQPPATVVCFSPATIMDEHLQSAQTDTEQGKYVYCIIKTETPRDFGSVGIGGRSDRVYTVHYKEFAAVVSNCPLIVFDPTRENALAHEHVNEVVMKDFTVLPMSFGTVFRTENDIKEFLKGKYDALSDVLQKMDGKIEFGLKVNWD